MYLSPNFSLEEMCKSSTALRKNIDNSPDDLQVQCMTALCENILQPIRDEFGPFIVSSGFRSVALCQAIGSKATSQHAKGQAADFEVPGVDNYDLALWIADNLPYDQLILEFYSGGNTGWLHCSYVPNGRKQKLTIDNFHGTRIGLINGS
jgi:zinc D-Ala-D-Ala carboxypeptidase